MYFFIYEKDGMYSNNVITSGTDECLYVMQLYMEKTTSFC
jgi:hypothetical protein